METELKGKVPSEKIRKQMRFYDKRLIADIVKAIEEGTPRKEILTDYGMDETTLTRWMSSYGSLAYQASKRKKYKPSDKRSVVRAVESGMSISEARISFNLSSNSLVHKWMKQAKQKNDDLSVVKSIVMNKTPKNKPTPEVAHLQQALAEAQLKIKALNTLIDVAEEHLHIDIRKKPGAKQSSK